jgi:hypothetical protein
MVLWAALSGRLKLCFSAPAVDWRMTETNWTGIIPQAGRTPRQLFDRQDFNLNSCMSYTTTAIKNHMKDTKHYAKRFKSLQQAGCSHRRHAQTHRPHESHPQKSKLCTPKLNTVAPRRWLQSDPAAMA